MHHHAKFCGDRANYCSLPRYDIFNFSKMAAIRSLGFVVRVIGPLTKGIRWSLSLCNIFGWNRCSSFHNLQVLIFCKLDLKMPIHVPELGILGDLTP